MKNKLIKIAKETAQVLKQINEVKAIALQGNLARGFADKYTDIDLICLCEKIPPRKIREKILEKLGIEKFVNGELPEEITERSEYFYYKGIRTSTYWIKLKDYEDFIKRFRLNKLSKEEFANVVSHIYYTKILYDPAKVFIGLKKKIPKPNKKIIRHFLYYLNRAVYGGRWPHGEKIKFEKARQNYLSLNSEFLKLIDYYLIIIFTLNGEYYLFPKWLSASLKRMKIKPKNLDKRLQQLAYLGNDKKSINKKIKVLTLLVDDLNRILAG